MAALPVPPGKHVLINYVVYIRRYLVGTLQCFLETCGCAFMRSGRLAVKVTSLKEKVQAPLVGVGERSALRSSGVALAFPCRC